MQNRLRDALARGEFAITVEVVTPERARPLAEALGPALLLARGLAGDPRVAGLSVTDRVRSDDDHDPVVVAAELGRVAGTSPLVHLSGKDRSAVSLAETLGRLTEAGLQNVLCVTGDRLKTPPGDRRVPYLDSVDAVRIARRLLPGAVVAAGVSPFKYTEEETLNQYLKMGKKCAAGADCLVTQVGWDPWKFGELQRYRSTHGLDRPVLANLMVLPVGAARYIHKGAVPGVVVTDDLLAIVEAEAQAPDRGKAARLSRLALQVVGVERMGYAGVQLSGLTTAEDVARVLEFTDGWRGRLPTLGDFWASWDAETRLPGGARAKVGRDPGYYLYQDLAPEGARGGAAGEPTDDERRRYRMGRLVHAVVFDSASPVPHLLRPLARRVSPASGVGAWLGRVEQQIKGPLFGCQLCGYCRLSETTYVCPETCPKGLANGPCGGSVGNQCEFGDRECIHSVRYRLAKATGQLDHYGSVQVPPVPEPRGGSSWLRHFSGRDPVLPPGPGPSTDRSR